MKPQAVERVPQMLREPVCFLFLQEDEALRRQIARLGARNWSLIAKAIPGRTGKSCRLRRVVVGEAS